MTWGTDKNLEVSGVDQNEVARVSHRGHLHVHKVLGISRGETSLLCLKGLSSVIYQWSVSWYTSRSPSKTKSQLSIECQKCPEMCSARSQACTGSTNNSHRFPQDRSKVRTYGDLTRRSRRKKVEQQPLNVNRLPQRVLCRNYIACKFEAIRCSVASEPAGMSTSAFVGIEPEG